METVEETELNFVMMVSTIVLVVIPNALGLKLVLNAGVAQQARQTFVPKLVLA